MTVRPVERLYAPETDRHDTAPTAPAAGLAWAVHPRRAALLLAAALLLLGLALSFSSEPFAVLERVSSTGREPAVPDQGGSSGNRAVPGAGSESVGSSVGSAVADALATLPPEPAADASAGSSEGRKVVVGNRSTVEIDVEGSEVGKVKVTNSGSATADTGGNTVIGNASDTTSGSASLTTGEAVAVGNDATTTVRVRS